MHRTSFFSFAMLLHRLQFLSLWKPRYAVYIETLGECYEAFALYSFGRYLIACLGEHPPHNAPIALLIFPLIWS
jgi:hypothetical protein